MTVAIIIRCFNEEAHIGRLLTGVMRQTHTPDEIILVDSGSTDATLSIASSFPVEIVSIDPSDFSFGRALNVGLGLSKSDIAVLASAHVYPVYDTWVEQLTKPFGDDQVALTYGRQQVPSNGRFAEQQLLNRWFPARSVPRQRHPFCNNANAAVRRSVWEDLSYDEDLTGLEDLDWAKRALACGHLLAYVAEAPIVHVHNETFTQVANRYRREAIAHKQIYNDQRLGPLPAAGLAAANIARDIRDARRQGGLQRHLVGIATFRIAQFYGTYRGFAQEGPVTELLKRRFYYPPKLQEESAKTDGAPTGRVIDYDEPLSQA